jgi:CRP-like cAMP-binding protein
VLEPGKPSTSAAKAGRPFNAQAFLESAGLAKTSVQYARGDTIFTQGDPCEHVLYIQFGAVKLSVLSETGREAVIAMLGPGDFFGEGCLAGQPVRMGSATAAARSTILLIAKPQMVRLLHQARTSLDAFGHRTRRAMCNPGHHAPSRRRQTDLERGTGCSPHSTNTVQGSVFA